MAELLADQGNPSGSKALAGLASKALLVKRDLDKAATALGITKGTTMDRLAATIGLGLKAGRHNELSRELLDVAMKGLIATYKDALDQLMRQLGEFSTEIGRENARAIEKAAEKAEADAARPPRPKRKPQPEYVPQPEYEPSPEQEPTVSSWQDHFCDRGVLEVEACVFQQRGCDAGSIQACWDVCGLSDYVKGGSGC
ncbi:MAG: hypothetical protein E5X63_35295 [Mesorhizobium sp.]|nr:MAG: hypothetical protein E5X63_35295 [Mesorhizobium sp.]